MTIRFKLRDPVSGLTHLFGALLSIVALVLLLYYSITRATPWHIVAFSVFGGSLILLYTASSLYHLLSISEKGIAILRRIDHMMIFVLIAGTYTPICLLALRGPWGWSLLSIIWGIALGGIVLKGFWFNIPRWVSTLIYALMGWLVVIAFFPLVKAIPLGGFLWLVAGGLLYTIGALIYGLKWPNITSKFIGFHEIFHIFVLMGSFSHFWLMFRYILPL